MPSYFKEQIQDGEMCHGMALLFHLLYSQWVPSSRTRWCDSHSLKPLLSPIDPISPAPTPTSASKGRWESSCGFLHVWVILTRSHIRGPCGEGKKWETRLEWCLVGSEKGRPISRMLPSGLQQHSSLSANLPGGFNDPVPVPLKMHLFIPQVTQEVHIN